MADSRHGMHSRERSQSEPFAALCCPRDGAELTYAHNGLRCGRCDVSWPVHAGIPDFVGATSPSSTRWQAAQRYELRYWMARGAGPTSAEREHLASAADGLARIFDEQSGSVWRDRVIHIGPAGHGEIHYLKARERWAVEPLAIALDRRGLLERGEVRFVAAMGEHLPFANGHFTAALIPNVIDHVADPSRLLAELHRCLAAGAPLWLTCFVTRPALAPALTLLSHTRLDYFAGHPFVFTPSRLRTLLEQAGFRLVHEQTSAAVETGDAGGLRARIKGRLLSVRYWLAVA